MLSNHLILLHSLLLLPSIFPSTRVFSNESILHPSQKLPRAQPVKALSGQSPGPCWMDPHCPLPSPGDHRGGTGLRGPEMGVSACGGELPADARSTSESWRQGQGCPWLLQLPTWQGWCPDKPTTQQTKVR